MESRQSGNAASKLTLTCEKDFDFEYFDAVFVDSGDRYLESDYNRILKGEKKKCVDLYSWKNDRAAAEFAVLCKDRDMGLISLNASELRSENGVLPSCSVKLSFIESVKAYAGHAGWYANNIFNKMPKGKRECFPEVIYSDTPVRLCKNSFKLVWAEISVPKDAAPGIYRGSITVTAEKAEKPVELEYSLEVLDATLPNAVDYPFDTEYWSHPYNTAYYYGVEPFSDEHLEILKQHMSLYKSLGGHAVTTSIVEEAWGGQTYGFGRKIHYPSMIKWIKTADGEWKFDYTHFDKWVTLNKSLGIADKIICYSMIPWKSAVRYYDEKSKREKKISVSPADKDGYRKIWSAFLKDFVNHLDLTGCFDSVYMGFDERRNMETALDLISDIKNRDGKTLKVSAAFNDFKRNEAIFGRLDYASVGLDQIRENLDDFKKQVELRRKENKQTTLYTATEHIPNSFTKSFPAESYWTILFAGSLNATGFLRWAYDAWVENPLEDSTHWSFPAGDCFLVYPSKRDEKVKESKLSLRLAKLDEGVRDVNKLYIMRESCAEIFDMTEKLFSQIKGQSENDYEFYTVKRSKPWERTAKWLTESGKNEMLKDMKEVKSKIYEISKLYCEIKAKNN